MIDIREIIADDAAAFVAHKNQLDTESKNMLYEPGERRITAESQTARLRQIGQTDNQTIFVAEDDGALVGHIAAFGMRPQRVRHRIHIVVGVVRSHWSQGIATRLFETLEDWARGVGARRLQEHDNGKQHGNFKVWYENGQIQSDSNYNNDKRHRNCKWWFCHGQIKMDSNWNNGHSHGNCKWWHGNGQIVSDYNCNNGKLQEL